MIAQRVGSTVKTIPDVEFPTLQAAMWHFWRDMFETAYLFMQEWKKFTPQDKQDWYILLLEEGYKIGKAPNNFVPEGPQDRPNPLPLLSYFQPNTSVSIAPSNVVPIVPEVEIRDDESIHAKQPDDDNSNGYVLGEEHPAVKAV